MVEILALSPSTVLTLELPSVSPSTPSPTHSSDLTSESDNDSSLDSTTKYFDGQIPEEVQQDFGYPLMRKVRLDLNDECWAGLRSTSPTSSTSTSSSSMCYDM